MVEDLSADEIETAVTACDGNLEAAAESLKVSLFGMRRRMTKLGLNK